MRALRIAAIGAAALVGAAVSASAGDQGDPEQDCGVSTPEMVACLGAKAAQWDKRLNAAYKSALDAAQGEQREQLRAAQRLWVQYRDANCAYYFMGEGTIARVEAADCTYRMTRARAEELEGAGSRN
ncbi:MAG: lysozyme inhibitor LprI family protein [Pseudolabrys sp.]